ncbi:MAG: hypothetical protein C0401_10495 [Anaerolinea sp.]|nr:hypothetical protein [Anaerolinea sp.]
MNLNAPGEFQQAEAQHFPIFTTLMRINFFGLLAWAVVVLWIGSTIALNPNISRGPRRSN